MVGLSNFEDFFSYIEKETNNLKFENIKIIVLERFNLFNFECHFDKFSDIKNQLTYYKKIIKIIERDHLFYNDYQKIINKFKERKEKLKINIVLAKHYNIFFKGNENMNISACYVNNIIYIFMNEKIVKKELNAKNIRTSIDHEFGHLIYESLLNNNKIKNLKINLFKDWKAAKLQIKNTKKLPYKNYFKHVSPLNIGKIPYKIENHKQSNELFAENFNIFHHNKKNKSIYFKIKNKKNKIKTLDKLFVNTYRYINKAYLKN